LCHPRIETLTRHASANSKLSAVANKERREIGLEQSVQTDTGEYEKRHISGGQSSRRHWAFIWLATFVVFNLGEQEM
jgi:hypothetical protein